MNLVQFDARIARRGKGAKGTVEVKTYGKPVVDENGIAKKFDYTDAKDYEPSAVMDLAQKSGFSLSELILRSLDAIEKSAAIKSQNVASLLQARCMKDFSIENTKDGKKVAKALAYQVITIAKALNINHDEAINMVKAAKK